MKGRNFAIKVARISKIVKDDVEVWFKISSVEEVHREENGDKEVHSIPGWEGTVPQAQLRTF